jgi:hypothetical protein
MLLSPGPAEPAGGQHTAGGQGIAQGSTQAQHLTIMRNRAFQVMDEKIDVVDSSDALGHVRGFLQKCAN